MSFTQQDALAILNEVRENRARLETCQRHDFPAPEGQPLRRRVTCSRCGGWTDPLAAAWYQRGLEHATQK